MKYDKARKNPSSFLALTSVRISLFDEFLPFFIDAHDEYFRWHDIKGKRLTRQRRYVIQSNSPLPTVADRLFFLLTYLKNNPTQEYHAAMFDMSQQQCGQWIHTLTEILRMALEKAGVLRANKVAQRKETDRRAESLQHRNIENAYQGGARYRRSKDSQNRKGRMQIAQE